ncbi:Phosphoribosylformylglycinamidine synthase [Melia azedarach]|uniref:Phosphoribosylformylglycinamidine synthase n=1 Tax=Melia azedarach TaxID=155640 RepID=A0ACC1YJP3_MELAZ|nr:Phosphoribosylformylglycinamidine synthase [Melia azedarach]
MLFNHLIHWLCNTKENSKQMTSLSLSLTTTSYFSPLFLLKPKFTSPRLSFPTRRRSRRRPRKIHPHDNSNCDYDNNYRLTKLSPDNANINLVLDFNQISILSSSRSKFHLFLSSAKQAYADLTTVVTVDDNCRLVISCRKSTLEFVGTVLLSAFVLVSVFRVLVKLGLGFRSRFGVQKRNQVVVRRDRSLGGREVMVGTGGDFVKSSFNKVLENPLSDGRVSRPMVTGRVRRGYRVRREVKLPKWWPVQVPVDQTLVVDKEEYQREANRLIRAIIDHRTAGQDIMEDDIIRLRRICRTSGVRVSMETINTRDSLYRTSIDFVLNACSRALSHSPSVEIDGEDAREFVAGLADNIGLENIRAARMVSAAVAARTRSCFLQAWALEMQGNRSEALLELSKICNVFQVFPPEESSPEMEMVAQGLEKLLKFEQREFLMNMLVGVCSDESHRSAAEALGLEHVLFHEGNSDQHGESLREN